MIVVGKWKAHTQTMVTPSAYDARTLATKEVEASKNMPNVKHAENFRMVGQREFVYIELKRGGAIYKTYVCFPDTVKPK